MKALLVVLSCVLAGLCYRAWFSDVGFFAVQELNDRVNEQREQTQVLAQRNEELLTEVTALRHTLAAVESRARTDLGMIKEGESFYLVVDDAAAKPASK